ncbi:MAG: hypothetical protein K2Y26_19450 [Gemmatimonadaceae bacterium]|nr:hypothetical protein [Gemmatimonadaceae bacterium]
MWPSTAVSGEPWVVSAGGVAAGSRCPRVWDGVVWRHARRSTHGAQRMAQSSGSGDEERVVRLAL